MAAASQHEKFARQYPPRPPIQSQHSSSVPSTPYQQARDVRFPSRSPSPNRGLSNYSPRSVASEAVGRNGTYRSAPGAPTVCKFEFAPELPKRRIKYVDGGDQELGPPKKEPKKSMDPNEEEKLSGDLRELYDRLLPSQESEDRRAQLCKKLERILEEEWPGNEIRVNMFGSSGNLLSSSDSDVDVCITTEARGLENMHELAKRLHKHGMEKVVCRAAAKVPIVKCWDPELQLACDVNVNNPLALENTRMIKTYVQLDDRVRPLAKIIKYWTKQRILNDAGPGGTISSYTWICMILSFLQRREPPVLPSLQKKRECKRSSVNGEPSQFADDIDELRGCGSDNKETLAELLFQFFRHYSYEFEYNKYVVSVREGRLLSRKEKGWETNSIDNKEGRHRLCVEEPFNTFRNLGNSADEYSWSGLHSEIRRAFELLADGCQVEKMCEQYEFPPEERHVFQRPPPKPKPTLTRSASQSGRPNHEPGTGGGRSRKNNRNQSSQRSGNRRASSGASFGNQRNLWLQSPPPTLSASDYFATKGNLHEHLYQQYMALQMHQDMLKSQLAQGQMAQQQSQTGPGQQPQGRGNDLTGSPDHRQYANGLASPRYQNNPPQTAPLLPGYLHHYPARFLPPSTMPQSRREEGTSTTPSSPSLINAVPAPLRRQVHRASITDGSSSSIRSQSQPGRSLPPNYITLQQQMHPGFDMSGAIGGQYGNIRTSSNTYAQGLPFSPLVAMHTGQSVDSAMPKEYVGYYVGQSPRLGPQYMAQQPPMQSMPPMTLRDPPQRQRRVTPELAPPIPNGRHNSRSPSPLSHNRNHSTIAELTPAQQLLEQSLSLPDPIADPLPLPNEIDMGGPIIVNGSDPAAYPKPTEKVNGITSPSLNGGIDSALRNDRGIDPVWTQALPLRNTIDTAPSDGPDGGRRRSSSPKMSPTFKATKNAPRLNFSPNGTSQHLNGTSDHFLEQSPAQAPLLSPVAELRTPSPTNQRVFEHQDSPQANGLVKAAQVANAKQVENQNPNSPTAKHERKGSLPVPLPTVGGSAPKTTPVTPSTEKMSQQNPWQQATSKKGHKKNKSTAKSLGGGQPMPANEAERKGG